jgi:tryptophan synthase beta subunit
MKPQRMPENAKEGSEALYQLAPIATLGRSIHSWVDNNDGEHYLAAVEYPPHGQPYSELVIRFQEDQTKQARKAGYCRIKKG